MFAAIDVGSNTVRMLIGKVSKGLVLPVLYSRKITRLKGGQTSAGLTHDAMQRTLAALQHFRSELLTFEVDALTVVGTEALRTAANVGQFIEQVRQLTGMSLNVLSGEEEALCSARGVLSVVDPTPPNAVIVDIGGGSTEIVVTSGVDVLFSHSCPLGVVRLTEMEGERADELIGSNLQALGMKLKERGLFDIVCRPSTCFVGTAGTITTLAAIDLGMVNYDWRQVNNYRLSASKIDHIYDRLAHMQVSEREQLPGMESGRGDLILPGLQVLNGLLEQFAKKELIISDFGLLEGLLLQMAAGAAIR